MRLLLFLSTLFFFQCQSPDTKQSQGPAQAEEAQTPEITSNVPKQATNLTPIETIRKQFKETNDSIDQFQMVNYQKSDSLYVGYFDEKSLRKLTLKTPSSKVDYYFSGKAFEDSSMPYFVFERRNIKETPIENRYYFFDEEYIRWVDSEGKIIEGEQLEKTNEKVNFIIKNIIGNFSQLRIKSEQASILTKMKNIESKAQKTLSNKLNFRVESKSCDDCPGEEFDHSKWFDASNNLVYQIESDWADHGGQSTEVFFINGVPFYSKTESSSWTFWGEPNEDGTPNTRDDIESTLEYIFEDGSKLNIHKRQVMFSQKNDPDLNYEHWDFYCCDTKSTSKN